ncbi:MAG: LamG domain-containing protein [Bryobacteraceae bacterium]|nr:LamG domain-containing protein [Bryobacteraceae bacterium]
MMRTAWLLMLGTLTLTGQDFKKSLTFHATFDEGTDAKFALGDKKLYTAKSYKEQAQARAGLHSLDAEIVPGQGRNGGGALRFNKRNDQAIFYQADKNVAFDPKNWTGTVSFWLSVDPEKDLAPGYCDPIQVTDKAYNDSAIWVDFTKDDQPRHFRLGVFGELKAWNPKNVESDKNPDFLNRLVVVKQPPFRRGEWTHVAITFAGLGSGKGTATLYVNGKAQGTTPALAESFAWDLSKGRLRLGVAYVGLFDDLAVFNRALTAKEVAQIASGRF